MASWTDDAARNRDVWTKTNSEYTNQKAVANWAKEMEWGMWDIPEAEVGVIGDVSGIDVVELGCGTAYWSAWLARAGARPVGVDITPAQLETARACMRETGIEFPLMEADAGATGLPDGSADLVLSEYGASIWVDPYRWIPEAARLLRPGGRLVFLCNSTLVILCSSDDPDGKVMETLQRPQQEMRRIEWDGVEFHLAHGERIDLLRANGFELERLLELYAAADTIDHPYYDFVSAEWARKWPAEELWVARKTR
ncbi:MAG TPA: class I SAM-dependent methyltransferase [Gaiellaceae bacterium]|jgi:SAM-dependent methyltransferase